MTYPSRSSLIALAMLFAACGTEAEPPVLPVTETLQGVQTAETLAAIEEPIFVEGAKVDRCKVLTLEDVSEVTGVPASAIQQRPISGCHYSWEAGPDWSSGSVMLTSARVHKSLDRAKSHFALFTKDVKAEEIAPQKEQVKGELAAEAERGEMSEAEAAIGSMLIDQMPEVDFIHRPLPIGSEAAIERKNVRIRYGNATMAFGGEIDNQPELDAELATELGRRIVRNFDELAPRSPGQ